jgi:hypothetical protein
MALQKEAEVVDRKVGKIFMSRSWAGGTGHRGQSLDHVRQETLLESQVHIAP